MGTRADFYLGRGKAARWLGSVAMDGYPDGEAFVAVKDAAAPEEWRAKVAALLAGGRYATVPEMGWPWPWSNSRLTDYAYAFDGGKVYASNFGGPWYCPGAGEEEPTHPAHGDEERKVHPCLDGRLVEFPDMTSVQKVDYGERSGLLILRAPKQV
jgi:hypothetical protein